MHFLKIHFLRYINAVGCVKKRHHLGEYTKCRQFSQCTCDALLCVSHTLQSALENGQEAWIVQIDFSAAFDRVNHLGILISSALWVLEVLSCLYWQSFYQTDHSKLWWMVVEVNWLMLYQECRREVFWARYCSSCTLRSFFPFWKISWSVMLMTPLWWLLCHPQAAELQ